jgi:peptide/nickel transport system substrate-binding protein
MVRFVMLCPLLLCACAQGDRERNTNELSVLISDPPESLDPRRGSSAVEMRVQELIFRGLVQVADDLSVVEDLAESIVIDGAQHLTITLKKNINFHTCFDGTPGGSLKAEDVIYSYESLRDPRVQSRKQRILADVDRFDSPDPKGREVRIHLRKPSAVWLGENGTLGILEKACAEKDPKAFARAPSGTGAFAFEAREADRRIWLKRFDPSVAYERMELRVVGDETSRLLELLKGRADVLTVTPSRPLLPPLKRRKELDLINAAGNGYSYLAFNLRLPELSDQRVRQAIASAIDREAIIEHKYLGLARPSAAMTPPDHWAHPKDLKPSAYNPRQAAALLNAAGWRTNPELVSDPSANQKLPVLKLEMRTTPEKFGRALSLVLQDQLRQVGIDLQLRINDWGTLYSQVKKGNFQLVRMEWIPVLSPALLDWVFHSYAQPQSAGSCQTAADCPGGAEPGEEASKERFSCSSGTCRRNGGNRGGYSNSKVDALLDAASRETQKERQAELYAKAQHILSRDLPYVSLWHEDRVWIVRKPWTGVELKPSGSFLGLLKAQREAAP